MDPNTTQDSFCNRLQNSNTAFLRRREGVIQLAQIACGFLVVILLISQPHFRVHGILCLTTEELVLILFAFWATWTTSLIVLASVFSTYSSVFFFNSLYGVMYHVTAVILYQASTIAIFITEGKSYQRTQVLVAGVFGQFSSFLYFISSFISFRSLTN
ncbi:uncharacterized protein LOC106468423 [Limulus polyphemus]|uniref:Uncharacterized protein LOC106468423 n=1 Tax=Limulus polyphemus TaxID=6850 RepID=A0ABM1BLC6_LIMPO|nr:uncharacterized protein LOC106468423 [Limulus polyphemus]